MKRPLILIGVFWLAILGVMVGIPEHRLRTGREILLKTVPVDPRDFFRGDYVVLSYEISTIDLKQLPVDRDTYREGQLVYVVLKAQDPYHVAAGVRSQLPDEGIPFIKGHVRSVSDKVLRLEYGIESYFVPEGQGRVLEGRNNRPDVRVAVDRAGNAIIKMLLLNGREVTFPVKRRGSRW